jgi:hypothetical protein
METQIVEIQKRLDDLRKENEELKTRQVNELRKIICEVNELGGLTVFGHGKYPLKLYAEQWICFLDNKDKILKFIKDNENELSWINEKTIKSVNYVDIKKMPFPPDISIKILNFAKIKIDIDDMIKYKIPPSKLSINKFFKIRMDKILNIRKNAERVGHRWNYSLTLGIKIIYDQSELSYYYQFKSQYITYKIN